MPNAKDASVLLNHHADKAYAQQFMAACHDLVEVLRQHCGPYAAYAVLPTQMSGRTFMDQYSKDGINIVNRLKTNTPLHNHLMRLASYVGERVDNACHDGTTTAMMLFCSLAGRITDLIHSRETMVFYYRHHLRQELTNLLTECEAVLNEDVLTVDAIAKQFRVEKRRAVWAVAYHQALIASKGDKELADKLADLLSTLPVDLHGQYILHGSGVETDERFILKQHDYDFELPGMVHNPEHYNQALRSELKLDNATLIVTPNNLVRGNPECEYLLQMITTADETKSIRQPLVILTPELNDPNLIEAIARHNVANPNAMVIPIHMQVGTASKMCADAICAIAGALPLQRVTADDPERAFIFGVTVEQRATRVYLKKLYTKTGDQHHPSFTDPTRDLFYTKTLSELQTYIKNATARHDPTKGSDRFLEHTINCFRYMSSQELVDLSIGGSSHEYMANLSVAQDAQGAAVSAIADGIILGGHARLLAHVVRELQAFPADAFASPTLLVGSKRARFDLLVVFAKSLIEILYAIYYPDFDTPKIESHADLDRDADEFIDSYRSLLTLDRPWWFLESVVVEDNATAATDAEDLITVPRRLTDIEDFLDGENTHAVLMQPIVGYREFFRRLHELLPKIANTTSLIDTTYQLER